MKRLSVIVLAGIVAIACTTGSGEPRGECVDDGDCDGVAICSADFECQEVQCLTSEQCGLEQYCFGNTCFSGCEQDSDCLSGFECNTATYECEVVACEDTWIDCTYGQRCNGETGECEYPGGLCGICENYNDPACEDAGGDCQWWDGTYYCLTPCDLDDPNPPRGFYCSTNAGFSGKQLWEGDCDDALHGNP